jgi:phytoene dehydrogenase-like protein
MPDTRDVIIVGAGHNALVTAFYLARGGLKPLLLERRPVAGGAAITDEFHPGFKCSTLAHSAGPMLPDIVQEMKLERHGLRMISPEPRVFAPSPEGRSLLLYSNPTRSVQEIARLSSKDAQKYPEFAFTLERLAIFMGKLLEAAPPALDGLSAGDLIRFLSTGRDFRSLGRPDMFRILQWIPMPVADLVGDWFESELLRATIAARGVFGTFLGPRSPGSSAVLLLRAASEPHPAGAGSYPKGGMGSLTQAMASAALEAGAELRTEAEVDEIVIKDGLARGVVLSSGEEIAARVIVSGADPKRTFGRLVSPAHLDPSFLVKVRNYRCQGTAAKVNLALAGLPTFKALARAAGASGAGAAPAGSKSAQDLSFPLAGRIHIGPAVDYLERAFDDAKYGRFSRQPYLDILIPSLLDSSLAPAGQHVMSIYAQFAPFKLSASENDSNADWNSQREGLGDTVIKTLSAYAPDRPGLILQRQVITPFDLEQIYGLTGGHIFHGELALDQLFSMRPLLGWSRYRTPVRGLYLCGSGTHPGTGLTGASGANAAREILKDWKRRRLTG